MNRTIERPATGADLRHMDHALVLARRGLGNTWPNPAVGCVIVGGPSGDRVVGRGWTQPGGRPHAEVMALAQAGAAARDATAYVTLEPCAHHGRTPPCAEALIQARVARVVTALTDPDPRVGIGQGGHYPRNSGLDECFGAGRRAAVMGAGFERDVGGRVPRGGTSLGKRHDLGMGTPPRLRPTAPDHAITGRAAHDDAADRRVGPGIAQATTGKHQRVVHVAQVGARGRAFDRPVHSSDAAGRSSLTNLSKSSAAWKFL